MKVICAKNLPRHSPLAFLLALFCFIDRFEMNDVLYGVIWTLYTIVAILMLVEWIYRAIKDEGTDVINEKN